MTDSKDSNASETASGKKEDTKQAPAENQQPTQQSTQQTAQQTAQQPTESHSQVTSTNGSSSSASGIKSSASGITAILLSLVALAGTGFTWYQIQVESVRSESTLAVGVAEIGGQVSRIGDSIALLKKQQGDVVTQEQLSLRISEINSALNAEVNSINQQQMGLKGSVDKINSNLEKGVNVYVLDEVAQLLKLANNSVFFANNVDSAINALRLADNQLKGLDDPRYTVVRSKINDEIASLKSIQQVDVASLSAQLMSMSRNIPSLPLANEPVAEEVKFVDEKTELKGWRAELSTLWAEIKNSIQVQRVDQPPKPLLVPQQRYFLNQNLQLTLNKAELALLQQQQSVFVSSIDTASLWLTDYFDTKDKRVSDVLRQLEQVKQTNIKLKLPSITGSYDALQTIRGGK